MKHLTYIWRYQANVLPLSVSEAICPTIDNSRIFKRQDTRRELDIS